MLSSAAIDRILNDSVRWLMTTRGRRHLVRPMGTLPPPHALPTLERWHVTSQDRLFHHLRRAWPQSRSRVMVDLGCHAGHGPHTNLSDALLWLEYFNETGGLVVGVDAHEDFALDQQRRFDLVPPYSETPVEKRAYTIAISRRDVGTVDFVTAAHQHVSCCAGVWCHHTQLEKAQSDHLCRSMGRNI